jgi:hypothetical protein
LGQTTGNRCKGRHAMGRAYVACSDTMVTFRSGDVQVTPCTWYSQGHVVDEMTDLAGGSVYDKMTHPASGSVLPAIFVKDKIHVGCCQDIATGWTEQGTLDTG